MISNQYTYRNSAVLPPEILSDSDSVSAAQGIFDDIKEQIISGKLLPGDRLPSERSLMELYGRSRTTVREALQLLDRAGFIRILPRRKPLVLEYTGSGIEKPINEAIEASHITLAEIKEFRDVIEGATAAWAAERRTDEDIKVLHNCILQMRESITDYKSFLRLDVDFHNLIVNACKNRTCAVILSSISEISRSYTSSELEKRTALQRKKICQMIYELHLEIFEKIRSKDSPGAREAMLKHFIVFEETVADTSTVKKNRGR